MVIRSVNIVDVRSGSVLKERDIEISGRRIIEIRPHEKDPNSREVLGNRWVIPGLIDAHVHLFEHFEGPKAGILPDESLDLAFIHAKQNLQELSRAGVTTVRETGAFEARNNLLRDSLNNDVVRAVRILSCGHHVTVADGHFWDRGRVWDRAAGALSNFVETIISEGADFVKVMNDDKIFTHHELRTIVDVAHRNGKKVCCHAFTPPQILQAIECNVDTIEHGFPPSKEAAVELKSKGIAICPTIVAAIDSNRDECEDQIEEAFPDCSQKEFELWHKNLNHWIPLAIREKVPIIVGTDAGIIPTSFDSIHREIDALKQMGATDVEIMKYATILSAEALGISKEVGVVEVGYQADLLVLGQDPTLGFREALNSIESRIFEGRLVNS